MGASGRISYRELGARLGINGATVSRRLHRSRLRTGDLEAIAEAMGYKFEVVFIDRKTGERI